MALEFPCNECIDTSIKSGTDPACVVHHDQPALIDHQAFVTGCPKLGIALESILEDTQEIEAELKKLRG